jgi:hypothetical protein
MLIRGADTKVWGRAPGLNAQHLAPPGPADPLTGLVSAFVLREPPPAPSVAGLSFCISWRAQKRATALHAGCESGALGRTGSLVKGGNLSIVLEAGAKVLP